MSTPNPVPLPPAAAVAASGGADLPVPQPSAPPANTNAPWLNDPVVSNSQSAGAANADQPWLNDPVSQQPTTMLGRNVRNTELVGRGLVTGAAGLLGAVSNAPRNLVNDMVEGVTHPSTLIPTWLGGNAPTTQPTPVFDTTNSGTGAAPSVLGGGSGAPAGPTPQLSDFVHPDRWQQAAEYFASQAGAPTPQTPGERIAYAAAQAAPTAALAPEAPLTSLAASMASGAASQGVAEAGGTPGEQFAAGLVAGGLPAIGAGGAALARGLTRGGDAGAAAAAQRIADAQAAGTTLTAGQATGSRVLQGVEGASSKLWGGGALNDLVASQDEHVGNTVRGIADNLAGGQEATPTTAGEAINAGATASKTSARTAEQVAYNTVDQLVPPTTSVDVTGTLGKLNTLATPTPGAEATTGALIPQAISTMRDNLTTDAGANGTIPYGAARALRTSVGNSIDWGFAPADPVKNGALKQVYGSLTQDINTAASAASPDAAGAVQSANALHQANVAQSDILDGIVNKAGGPEAVYNAAMSGTKTGATKLSAVMSALNPDQQNLVRGTVLGKLGLVPASRQGAAGDVFKLDSFLSHWNQLSDDAKNVLFPQNATGPLKEIRPALDSVAKTAADIRGKTLLKNPSGSGEAFAHAFTMWDALETLGAGGATLFHHAPAAASAVAGNWGIARLLTRPWFARWLATSTKMPASAVPGAVAALHRASVARGDQDGVNLAGALSNQITQRQGR